jgi:peptidoglycan/xylan/chitin deacetylase (PgdA/CDA1 family)
LADVAVRAIRLPPSRAAVNLVVRRTRALRGLLGVLTYHRIVDDPGPLVTPGMASATSGGFRKQIDDLARDFDIVSMADVLYAYEGRVRLPDRALTLTFDDGYRDFAEVAWPILRKHALPVTLFVATGYVGGGLGGFWWDRLHAAILATPRDRAVLPGLGATELGAAGRRAAISKKVILALKGLDHGPAMETAEALIADLCPDPATPPILDWETLRQLAKEGVALAPHTAMHPLLSRVPIDEARGEIEASVGDLRREIDAAAPVFAYPSGALTDAVAELLPELGIRLAFTTRRGVNDLRRADPMRLNRINVGLRTDAALIRAQLVAHALRTRAPGDRT